MLVGEAINRDLKSRRRTYLVMMGVCLLLYLLSWTVLARFSATAAIVVSISAMAIPPFAAIIANRDGDHG
jgi:Protein of unknown function (DUF3099)